MTKQLCIVFAIALVGCSKTTDEVVEETPGTTTAPLVEQPRAPKQGATPKADPPPPSAATSDLPRECLAYKDVVDQLASCEKLGAQRDVLKSQFETSWKAYGDLPLDARGDLGDKCLKAARDLKAAVAATCGW